MPNSKAFFEHEEKEIEKEIVDMNRWIESHCPVCDHRLNLIHYSEGDIRPAKLLCPFCGYCRDVESHEDDGRP